MNAQHDPNTEAPEFNREGSPQCIRESDTHDRRCRNPATLGTGLCQLHLFRCLENEIDRPTFELHDSRTHG